MAIATGPTRMCAIRPNEAVGSLEFPDKRLSTPGPVGSCGMSALEHAAVLQGNLHAGGAATTWPVREDETVRAGTGKPEPRSRIVAADVDLDAGRGLTRSAAIRTAAK